MSSFDSTRNDLIKLPAFLIKCKAMMGICIYCVDKSADTLYLEKGASRLYRQWVIFYNQK